MKPKVLWLVLLVGLVGYAVGTESGRRRRDELIRRVRSQAPVDELLRKVRRQGPVDDAVDAAQAVADDVVDLTASAADQAEAAVDDITSAAQS